MQTLKMKTELLDEFLGGLKDWGELWAPVEKGPSVFALEPIDDVGAVRPDALRTILPPKKLLLKPQFAMLEKKAGSAETVDPGENSYGSTVLFGIHACDIHAIEIMDMLYLTDFSDNYYAENRKNLTIVGYGCTPDEKCFCKSMGTSTADSGFDLFLTPLNGVFLVAVGSSRGDDVVRSMPQLFEESGPEDTRAYLQRLKQREASFQIDLDVTDLPYVLELKKEDPIWQELGKKCLCCGSCSMVCPTCSCFNIADRFSLDGSAARDRTWDACLYRDYAMVAGGHNFRADRADRVKNRYYHKQEAFVREFGMPSCVGCGRCIESCPTKIHVVEVFEKVRGTI